MTEFRMSVDFESEVPIYVQVKNRIRMLIDQGELKPGTQLPTVRDLAVELEINPNTVSRIYADLEREGYLFRRRGIGTFAVDPRKVEKSEPPGKAQLVETLRQLRALGYSSRQILEMTAEVLREVKV
ncbi:GntR family transcriptional regulator [bacterium]|nr:GntR family transcriptional regulator [bacterium]